MNVYIKLYTCPSPHHEGS